MAKLLLCDRNVLAGANQVRGIRVAEGMELGHVGESELLGKAHERLPKARAQLLSVAAVKDPVVAMIAGSDLVLAEKLDQIARDGYLAFSDASSGGLWVPSGFAPDANHALLEIYVVPLEMYEFAFPQAGIHGGK